MLNDYRDHIPNWLEIIQGCRIIVNIEAALY